MRAPTETNTTTHFLREVRALQMIRDLVATPHRKTVVWSVGCSTGDEPYGLAMLCRQAACDVEILATDINPIALERAQRGRYHDRNLRHVDESLRGRWFTRDGDSWQIASEIREMVRFRRHDITSEGAPRHDVDVALCRNVMVYFNPDEVQRAVSTICASLRPGALLILGASEWLRPDIRLRGTLRLTPMERAGVIVYQRIAAPPLPLLPVVETPPPPPREPEPSQVVEQLRTAGDARLDAGQPAEARVSYALALEQAPLLADLHLRIALCYLHTRQTKEAIESLRRALFLTPQLWQAWMLLADLAHEPAQARHYLAQARDLLEAEVPDVPALRVFSGDHAAVLAAVRHKLRGLR